MLVAFSSYSSVKFRSSPLVNAGVNQTRFGAAKWRPFYPVPLPIAANNGRGRFRTNAFNFGDTLTGFLLSNTVSLPYQKNGSDARDR